MVNLPTSISRNSSYRQRRKRQRRQQPHQPIYASSRLLCSILSLSAAVCFFSDAFGIHSVMRVIKRQQQQQRQQRNNNNFITSTDDSNNRYPSSVLFADTERKQQQQRQSSDTSWSRKPLRNESPFQVRRRVRAVLEKAKGRTGIENSSSVVAEAASIGGEFGTDYTDFVYNKNGKESTSIIKNDNSSKVNGDSTTQNAERFKGINGDKQHSTGDTTNKNSNYQASSSSSSNSFPTNDTDTNGMEFLQGDVPAASDFFDIVDPLPFELPQLSQTQIQQLQNGERLQEQSRMGREGSGYVVLDVKAPPYVVWECLLDFESYPETIPTVREVKVFTNTKLPNSKNTRPNTTNKDTRHYGIPSVTRAAFVLSKFRLNIAAIHKYTPHPAGDYMVFTLDPSCTNLVLKGAQGTWYTEANPEGREGYTRVYLLCEVQISRALPSFIVDYAADRAMPRATTWLRPQVEAAAELWLKRPSRS